MIPLHKLRKAKTEFDFVAAKCVICCARIPLSEVNSHICSASIARKMKRRARSVGSAFNFTGVDFKHATVVHRRVRSKSLNVKENDKKKAVRRTRSFNELTPKEPQKPRKQRKTGIRSWKFDNKLYVSTPQKKRSKKKKGHRGQSRQSRKKNGRSPKPARRATKKPERVVIVKEKREERFLFSHNFVDYYLVTHRPNWPKHQPQQPAVASKPTKATAAPTTSEKTKKVGGPPKPLKLQQTASTTPPTKVKQHLSSSAPMAPENSPQLEAKVETKPSLPSPPMARRRRSRRTNVPSKGGRGKVPLSRSLGSSLPHTPPVFRKTEDEEGNQKQPKRRAPRPIKTLGAPVLPYWLVKGTPPPKPGDTIPQLVLESSTAEEKEKMGKGTRVRRRSRGFRMAKTPWRKPEIKSIDPATLSTPAPDFNTILAKEREAITVKVTVPDQIDEDYVEGIHILLETYHHKNALHLLRTTEEGRKTMAISILIRDKLRQKEKRREHVTQHEFQLLSFVDAFLFQQLFYQSAKGKDQAEDEKLDKKPTDNKTAKTSTPPKPAPAASETTEVQDTEPTDQQAKPVDQSAEQENTDTTPSPSQPKALVDEPSADEEEISDPKKEIKEEEEEEPRQVDDDE